MLKDEQQAILASTAPALVCVAGPGSGKTTTLTEAIAQRSATVHPSQIMAVTFTRTAAAQLRERLGQRCDTRKMTIGTFHSIAYEMVRACWWELEYASDTIFIFDRLEAKKLLKETIFTSRYSCSQSSVTGAIEHFSVHGVWPDMPRDVEAVVNLYLRALREHNAIDYPSVSVLAHTCLANGWLRGQWTDIFVDEAQDLDRLQHAIFRLLAPERIMFVGDPDQLIYGWRGAEVDLMRRSVTTWGAEVRRLERNYRSRPFIVEAASRLIAHNSERIAKEMVATVEGDGAIGLVAPEDVPDLLASPPATGTTTAVLARTHDVLHEVSAALTFRDIPHRLVGLREKLLEREDVKNALAVLAFPRYPNGGATAQRVMRLLGMSDLAIERLFADAKLSGRSYFDTVMAASHALRTVYEGDEGVLTEQLAAICSWLRSLDGGLIGKPEKDLMGVITDYVRQEPWAKRDAGRLIAWINLRDGQDEVRHDEPIQLLTVHAAKGLEFDRVVIVGLHDRVFPHKRSTSPEQLEEERRLMFVAMTRARHELILCPDPALPSRFIEEIAPGE